MPKQTKIKYKTNPFTEDLVIPIKNKMVRVSKDNDVWINQNTGEVSSTNVVSYKQVDGATFTKLFVQNIALSFNLTSAGIKSLNVLLYAVQYQAIDKDLVQLDEYTLNDFLETNSALKLSLATFYRGLDELVKAEIIARNIRLGQYFVNPNFCFNGDRVSFTNAIERKKPASQVDMFDEQDLLN